MEIPNEDSSWEMKRKENKENIRKGKQLFEGAYLMFQGEKIPVEDLLIFATNGKGILLGSQSDSVYFLTKVVGQFLEKCADIGDKDSIKLFLSFIAAEAGAIAIKTIEEKESPIDDVDKFLDGLNRRKKGGTDGK